MAPPPFFAFSACSAAWQTFLCDNQDVSRSNPFPHGHVMRNVCTFFSTLVAFPPDMLTTPTSPRPTCLLLKTIATGVYAGGVATAGTGVADEGPAGAAGEAAACTLAGFVVFSVGSSGCQCEAYLWSQPSQSAFGVVTSPKNSVQSHARQEPRAGKIFSSIFFFFPGTETGHEVKMLSLV
jgi:hypothetical protein